VEELVDEEVQPQCQMGRIQLTNRHIVEVISAITKTSLLHSDGV
jgi:hypothetical protein